jgi:hypothetical protein
LCHPKYPPVGAGAILVVRLKFTWTIGNIILTKCQWYKQMLYCFLFVTTRTLVFKPINSSLPNYILLIELFSEETTSRGYHQFCYKNLRRNLLCKFTKMGYHDSIANTRWS